MPSILRNGLGFSQLESQYLTVPVYLLGGISFFTAGKLGDKFGWRGTPLGILDTFAVIGYALLATVESNAVRYFACYLIAIPLYCGPGLNETWIINNTAPHYRRATALGLSQAVGNVAGVVAPQVYSKSPYLMGHWSSFACAVICMILISIQIIYFKTRNNEKAKIASGAIPDDRKSQEGEDNLEFKYRY